jgi:hypothetical protein
MMVLVSLSQNSILYGRCWYVNSSSQRYLLQPVLNETRGYPPVSYLCLLCRIICSRTTTAQGESDRLDITYVRDKLMSGSTYARHNFLCQAQTYVRFYVRQEFLCSLIRMFCPLYNMQICFIDIRSLLFSIVLVLIGTWKWWKMAITLNFCVSSCAVIGHGCGNVER